jgi:hypothetical protein
MTERRSSEPKGSFPKRRAAVTLLLLVGSLARGLGYAQPMVVLAEDFDSPESVTPWTYRSDPETVIGGGILWSALQGQPPGSLELLIPTTPNAGRAFSICLPFGGNEPWTARVDAMAIGAVNCGIDLVEHDALDCSDDRVGSGQGPGTGLQNQWLTLERERPLFPGPESTRAIKLELIGVATSAPGGGSCYFDNIVVTGTTAPPAVPAQRPAQLALLAAAIALLALRLLRRN